MHLTIRGERLISDIQQDFSLEYPYLKIEFFRTWTGSKDRFPPVKMLPHHLQIKDAWSGKRNEGDLEINGMMTVEALEQAFVDRFGLLAQLFRKSGNLWLETTITDAWTLKQQNDHGREISTDHRRPGAPDEIAYDLNR